MKSTVNSHLFWIRKDDGTFQPIATFRGAQGLQGVKGDTGDHFTPRERREPDGSVYMDWYLNGECVIKGEVSIRGLQGMQGVIGLPGKDGDKGDKGDAGLSAYDAAVLAGYEGDAETLYDILARLEQTVQAVKADAELSRTNNHAHLFANAEEKQAWLENPQLNEVLVPGDVLITLDDNVTTWWNGTQEVAPSTLDLSEVQDIADGAAASARAAALSAEIAAKETVVGAEQVGQAKVFAEAAAEHEEDAAIALRDAIEARVYAEAAAERAAEEIRKLGTVYHVKGNVATEADLPTTAEAGDVYNVLADGSNHVWVLDVDGAGTPGWDVLGSVVDLSDYETAAEAEAKYLQLTGGTVSGNVTLNGGDNYATKLRFGGTAKAAGLMTRGVSGADNTASNKGALYLNYDGETTPSETYLNVDTASNNEKRSVFIQGMDKDAVALRRIDGDTLYAQKEHTHDQYLTEHQDLSGYQPKLTAGDNITIDEATNTISATGGGGGGGGGEIDIEAEMLTLGTPDENKVSLITIGYGASTDMGGCTIKDCRMAIGNSAKVTGFSSVAIGHNAHTSSYSTALGNDAQASSDYATAIGNSAQASSGYATALGYNAQATGGSATAIGNSAQASSGYATALGYSAQAWGGYATALGYSAQAWGGSATALGHNAQAWGGSATALGHNAQASSGYATALGYYAHNATAESTLVSASSLNLNERMDVYVLAKEESDGEGSIGFVYTDEVAGTSDGVKMPFSALKTLFLANGGVEWVPSSGEYYYE